jgi:hypothetical protein
MADRIGDFGLILRENPIAAVWSRTHGVRTYYCIASASELWFERLDFDAF